jgi:hypothetical protein
MGGRAVAFRWTAEAVALLTCRYAAGDARSVIAELLNTDPRVVGRKIEALDLARALSLEERRERKLATSRHMAAVGLAKRGAAGEFVWTPEQLARLRRLYVVELLSASEIAALIGCEPRAVSRKAHTTGLTRLRDVSVRQRERLRAQQLASARAAEARAAERDAAPKPATDAELIAAAVAAGKVRHIAPGHACGLTGLERHLWASGPLTGRIAPKSRGAGRGRAA